MMHSTSCVAIHANAHPEIVLPYDCATSLACECRALFASPIVLVTMESAWSCGACDFVVVVVVVVAVIVDVVVVSVCFAVDTNLDVMWKGTGVGR